MSLINKLLGRTSSSGETPMPIVKEEKKVLESFIAVCALRSESEM